jgi:uncharacterized membrane protein
VLNSESMRWRLRWLAAIFFVGAGIAHFLRVQFYVSMIPPALPWPAMLVIVSGVAEIAGGAGLLVPRVRVAAGWGLMALLVAVFPANIYMALHPELFNFATWLLWARLPLQLVLLGWVWFVMRKPPSFP